MPETGSDLVDGMYDWCNDDNNVVVRHLNNAVKSLRKRIKDCDKWDSRTLINFNEEVIRKFVDINGKQTNEVKHITDDDGRQRISFFVKTVRMHDETPEEAKLVSCNGLMDTSVEYDEETVGDVRAELDEKLNGMKDEMKYTLTDMFKKMFIEIKAETANQVHSAVNEAINNHQARAQQAAAEHQHQQAEKQAFMQAQMEANAAASLAGLSAKRARMYPDNVGS